MPSRLEIEERNKKKWIYENFFFSKDTRPLVTRVFPEKKPFEQCGYAHSHPSPTLYIPFGKRLGTFHKVARQDYLDDCYAKATLGAALMSIPAQVCYDIFWAAVYSITLPASLVLGVGYALHASWTGDSDSAEEAETFLGNVICAPYFLLLILVDLCREVFALVMRTYATIRESEEGRQQDYWYADDRQFEPISV